MFSNCRSVSFEANMSTTRPPIMEMSIYQTSAESSGAGVRTLEFRYGMCLSPPFSPFSPSAAMTSPRALRLLFILCVSRTRSLSAPFAKLTFKRSLPARSTRFKLPSHRSPVPGQPAMPTLTPLMRSVKTECERDERSFIIVAATLRRDWAIARSERTCDGEVRLTTSMSVTRVEPVLESCLISCFFLSNSPFPKRSLMVSLYWET